VEHARRVRADRDPRADVTELARLLEDPDTRAALSERDRGGEAGKARADHEHVASHALSIVGRGPELT